MDEPVSQRKTRQIDIGGIPVGGDAPVVVQSMCATSTMDIDATVAQTHQLAAAGAGIVRFAMDNEKEVAALKEIRAQTRGIVISVDLLKRSLAVEVDRDWVRPLSQRKGPASAYARHPGGQEYSPSRNPNAAA